MRDSRGKRVGRCKEWVKVVGDTEVDVRVLAMRHKDKGYIPPERQALKPERVLAYRCKRCIKTLCLCCQSMMHCSAIAHHCKCWQCGYLRMTCCKECCLSLPNANRTPIMCATMPCIPAMLSLFLKHVSCSRLKHDCCCFSDHLCKAASNPSILVNHVQCHGLVPDLAILCC